MPADHGALALVELVGKSMRLTDLDFVEDPVKCQFRSGIADRIPDRIHGPLLRGQWLVHATRRALHSQQAFDLRWRKATCSAQVVVRGLAAVDLQVRLARGLDPSEASDRSVRQRYGPRQLRDEFLHRLAHPERGVRPKRSAKPGVVSMRREQ